MTIRPQTTGNQVFEQIVALLEPGKILSADDPRMLAVMHEIDRLANADQDSALQMRALALHLVGDLDGALDSLAKCEIRRPDDDLALIVNYLRCLHAQEVYARKGSPRTGFFTSMAKYGYACGAFRTMASFLREAESMHLSNLSTIPKEQIFAIDRMMNEFGIEDIHTANVLEIAGRVLESNGLMFYGNGPDVEVYDVPDELRAVHLTYHLSVSSQEAVAISMQFVDQLIANDISIPQGLHVMFSGREACQSTAKH